MTPSRQGEPPTIAEVKADLDELHYQADNMGEPWLLDAARRYRWLLNEYLQPTLKQESSEDDS